MYDDAVLMAVMAMPAMSMMVMGAANLVAPVPGPPGKTMMAKRLAGILPALTFEEALEAAKVHSVAGILPKGAGLLAQRLFRSPHHTVSGAGLSGGGAGMARPGEVSLAHHGLLFPDELPEFARNVLELLRQSLEDGSVTIACANMTLSFPLELHAGGGHESLLV